MILAISGSPRENRMIHSAIKDILKDCESPYEIVTLRGKRIGGCIACTACASDNVCKVKDDWNDLAEKMKKADIIIFGSPNYYGLPTATAHAFWERTFSFRHMGTFTLKGKLGVTLSTCRGEIDPVKEVLQKFMKSNQMEIIGHVATGDYAACYSCGEGHTCQVGNVVPLYGVLEEILPCHLPPEVENQERTQKEIQNIRKILTEKGVQYGKPSTHSMDKR